MGELTVRTIAVIIATAAAAIAVAVVVALATASLLAGALVVVGFVLTTGLFLRSRRRERT